MNAVNKNRVQIVSLIGLGAAFLAVPQLAELFGRSLDTLPIRMAALLLLLASLAHDPYVALGVFMVVTAIYAQHHQYDLLGISGIGDLHLLSSVFKTPEATANLNHGGQSDEVHEPVDFMPSKQVQDNSASKVAPSINEKEVLVSEPLGSKAEDIFSEEASKNIERMANSSS